MSQMPFIIFILVVMSMRISMTAWQWRNIQTHIKQTQAQYKTGYLAIGQHKGLIRSAIVLLVVDENEKVVCLQAMRGISMFARFKELPECHGGSYLSSCQSVSKTEQKAIAQAREQVKREVNRQTIGGNRHDTLSTIN